MLASILHLAFACVSALSFNSACTRAPNANAETNAASAVFFETMPTDAQGDDALVVARRLDREGRRADGQLGTLSPQEHLRRAAVYLANRAFAEAREHWQAFSARYPNDANVPAALFGLGRSFYQERRYAEALPLFTRLGQRFADRKEGREGFYYVAATLLRLGRPADAAVRYTDYAAHFPQGERIDNAYLNAIDSWREAGRNADALDWIKRTRQRFPNSVTETNAMFALLRLQVAAGAWQSAVSAADELLRKQPYQSGAAMTQPEVAYLRAYSLEQAGQKAQAAEGYQTISDRAASYYGGLSTARLRAFGGAFKSIAETRAAGARREIVAAAGNYPAPFRDTILRAVARQRSVDARFVLAIMRQESGYNPRARSAAAARGLMQLTTEIAAKYGAGVGLNNVVEDDLYQPEVNLPLACAYLSELFTMFPNLPEAVAAAYNGGEDNVARWVQRATQKDAGVFTSEIGFAESKDYALKVMANYRAYQQLYTADLRRR